MVSRSNRAIDGVAGAHRRLTAEVVGEGRSGSDGVAAWSAARGGEVTRIRGAVDTIVASGLDRLEAHRRGEPARGLWRVRDPPEGGRVSRSALSAGGSCSIGRASRSSP
jgi:hypothetical protein